MRPNEEKALKLIIQRGKGDVKKQGGPDPYSYVPIDQAARGKKGQQSRMSMTNKKKGSKA
jgi:ribosomal RNA-processing protein 12